MSVVKTLVPDPTRQRANPARNAPHTHETPQGAHDEGELALVVTRLLEDLTNPFAPIQPLEDLDLDEEELLDELVYGRD